MADFARCMHSKDSQMIALYRKTPIFKKNRRAAYAAIIIFIWDSLPEPPPFGGGMGGGIILRGIRRQSRAATHQN